MRLTKAQKKAMLSEWNQYCDEIQELTPLTQNTINESESDKNKRIQRLLRDYDAFVSYYFPHVTRGTRSAKFHLDAAKRIKADKNFRGLFEWPRGHAKSSHMSLMIRIWLMVQGEIKMSLIISKNQENASKLLGKIAANLEHNKRLINDFGEFKGAGDWSEGDFTTRQGVNFMALGRGQSPRGLSSNDSFRPNDIVIDDLDDDELVENPARVKKVYDWLMSAVFGAMDMGRGRFTYVGNRIGQNSVLAMFAQKKGIYHSKINALDKDGKPAWIEKYTLEEIQEAIEFMGYAMSQKEFFNNPIIEGKRFKGEWWIWGRVPKLTTLDAIVAYCDPSWKSGKKNDHKSITIVGYKKLKLYLIKVFNRISSINVMVDWFYNNVNELPESTVLKMEAIFMQEDLLEDFDKEGIVRGWQLPITGDYRSKPPKDARIESLASWFERGQVIINSKEKDDPDMQRAKDHTLAWDRGTNTPDDFLDALEGAVSIIKGMAIPSKKQSITIGERDITEDFY